MPVVSFDRGRCFPGARVSWRRQRVPVVAFLIHAAAAFHVFAQVSPGPLSGAHAGLEGSTKCFQCHRPGASGLDEQCLACHKQIAELIAGSRGLHGREAKSKCAGCHPEHAGRDFSLTNWPEEGPRDFDHRRAGWPLSGKHQSLACRDCHNKKFRHAFAADGVWRTYHSMSWVGLDTTCAGCHEDVHKGALGADCARCHSAVSWKVETFDHARTTFPLLGKHLKTPCEKCHMDTRLPLPIDAAGKPRPLFKPLPHEQCTDCHQDPHAGRLGGSCAKCHTADDWRQVPKSAFDHDKTRYPLRGLHRTVACEKCHDPKTAWGPRPKFASCGSCHRDAHAGTATLAGKPADCEACHDTGSYRLSTYTVARHMESAYPLTGLHASVACDRCHRKDASPAGVTALGSAGVMLRVKHARCTDCHADSHRGEFVSRTDGGACEACHGTEGWRPSRFTPRDHAQTRFLLEGRHVDIPCAACHGPGRKDLPPVPVAKAEGPAPAVKAALRGIETECVQCHRDPHGDRYGSLRGGAAAAPRESAAGATRFACTDCHDVRSFNPSAMGEAAHRRTAYPLEGAHRAVPCQACHKELEALPPASSLLLAGGPARRLEFRDARRRCVECHADTHQGQFASRPGGGACEECHLVDAFRPVSRFDHTKGARFALGGAHARVPCARCHPTVPSSSGGSFVKYRDLPQSCEGCHGAKTPAAQTSPPGAGPPAGTGSPSARPSNRVSRSAAPPPLRLAGSGR